MKSKGYGHPIGGRARRDSETARFTALLDEHVLILRKVAGLYTSTETDRLDLVQDITLQLWRAFPSFDADRRFSTWMYRIALNVAISNLRGPGNPTRRTVPLDDLPFEIADSCEVGFVEDERVLLLRRSIGRLDPLDRALLLLYLDDNRHREIAEILGISESNVSTKLMRLKRSLRASIVANHERTTHER